jgi:hypothetical protein
MTHTMTTATFNLEPRSARRYGRTLWARLAEFADERIDDLIEEQAGELTFDEFRECIKGVLESAMRASGSEFVKPDYAQLSASLEDIRRGRCRDIQDVIDEFQSSDS